MYIIVPTISGFIAISLTGKETLGVHESGISEAPREVSRRKLRYYNAIHGGGIVCDR